MKKALIFWGGWDGHTPKETAELFAQELKPHGFDVTVVNSLSPLEDCAALKELNLIVPVWTMGQISEAQLKGLNDAVRDGVGLAGVHGGMCDAFRRRVEYAWMTGGQFVAHPYVGEYTVRLTGVKSPITSGMKPSFQYNSEQYYMVVDPGVTILADTVYNFEGREIVMPVVWTKTWGKGRVFYSALGHTAAELKKYPDIVAMTTRGMLWAAEGKNL